MILGSDADAAKLFLVYRFELDMRQTCPNCGYRHQWCGSNHSGIGLKNNVEPAEAVADAGAVFFDNANGLMKNGLENALEYGGMPMA